MAKSPFIPAHMFLIIPQRLKLMTLNEVGGVWVKLVLEKLERLLLNQLKLFRGERAFGYMFPCTFSFLKSWRYHKIWKRQVKVSSGEMVRAGVLFCQCGSES